ncbi:MAG TPA: urease accessory protein UreD [Planctomycetota bacterium]
MRGRLRLVLGLDALGRCEARDQYSTQLLRVLRVVPGSAPGEGIVYLLNPSGGLAQGDEVDADIRVTAGAHAVVTAPSATRVYRMESGEAVCRTRLDVEAGASLEYLPEPLIPHGGASYTEEVDLRVASGGRALIWSLVGPGRAARGESLAYRKLALRLRIEEGGRPILLERAVLEPERGLRSPAAFGTYSHYGLLVAVGGDSKALEAAWRRTDLEGTRAGVGRLEGSGALLKVLAGESRQAQAVLDGAREAAVPILWGRPASLIRRC